MNWGSTGVTVQSLNNLNRNEYDGLELFKMSQTVVLEMIKH